MGRTVWSVFLSLVLMLMSACASFDDPGGVKLMSGYARAIAWSPDGKEIAVVGQQDLVVHDIVTMKAVLRRKPSDTRVTITEPPAAIAYSPDGKTVATAGFDGGVILWDVPGWSRRARLEHADGATTLAFTPDGTQLVAAGAASALMVFDVGTRELRSTLAEAPSGVLSVAVSPDGRSLATGELSQQVRVWNLAERQVSATTSGYAGPVLAVAYSPDGRYLGSNGGGRDARLLDLTSPESNAVALLDPAKSTPEEESARGIAAIASLMGAARTSQLTGAPGLWTVPGSPPAPRPEFNCPIVFSPDGKLVALIHLAHELSSSYHVEVYELASKARVSRFTGVSSLAFSPDGRRLAVGGIVRVLVFDALTGKEVVVDSSSRKAEER